MAIRYYDLLGDAKAGGVRFRIRLEYDTESPESLISSDLSIATTKNTEILNGDSVL